MLKLFLNKGTVKRKIIFPNKSAICKQNIAVLLHFIISILVLDTLL
jgi:hypothetical protein